MISQSIIISFVASQGRIQIIYLTQVVSYSRHFIESKSQQEKDKFEKKAFEGYGMDGSEK